MNVGLIGLAVMGANLARNLANHGTQVVVFNRSRNRTEDLVENYGSNNLVGVYSLEEMIEKLERPRKLIIMVQAGDAVDEVIDKLIPLLTEGDIIIDGGNSFFKDTQRRFYKLKEYKLHFVGCGISGGEEGALKGPSLMPGGDKSVWENHLKAMLEPIAARDFEGGNCVSYIGEDGAGHFVKMVHNGIEYAVMQLIAESYFMLKQGFGLSPEAIADIFGKYNNGRLSSYLFEITQKILRKRDDLKEGYLIDSILDKAGSKGTGMWTSVNALERGVALPAITAAVFARYISGEKTVRSTFSKVFPKTNKLGVDQGKFEQLLERSLYLAILSTYAQGFELIKKAAAEEKWDIEFAEIARIWQGGCIIRAELLKFVQEAFNLRPGCHLFEIETVAAEFNANTSALREVCALAISASLPIPALYGSLEYFESLTTDTLSASLLQAQRDFFGAHTYERIDKEGIFHTLWNEEK